MFLRKGGTVLNYLCTVPGATRHSSENGSRPRALGIVSNDYLCPWISLSGWRRISFLRYVLVPVALSLHDLLVLGYPQQQRLLLASAGYL